MLAPEQQDAVVKIARAAVASEHTTGCPAEFTAAQCVFESAYLSRCPGNNCFGIKADARGSGTQYVLTREYIDGTWRVMQLEFETYVSLADCFSDHARLIQSGVYEPAWQTYQKDHNLDNYIRAVSAHYATDPTYAAKMMAEANSSTIQLAVQAARQH